MLPIVIVLFTAGFNHKKYLGCLIKEKREKKLQMHKIIYNLGVYSIKLN